MSQSNMIISIFGKKLSSDCDILHAALDLAQSILMWKRSESLNNQDQGGLKNKIGRRGGDY